MNKTLLTLALLFAAPTALATAPTTSYLQVQDTTDTATDDFGATPGEGEEGVVEDLGENIDQAAQDTGEAVDDVVDPADDGVLDTDTTLDDPAVDTTETDPGVLDAEDDGLVDAEDDGLLDTQDPASTEIQNDAVTTPAENDGIAGNEVNQNDGFPWGLLGLIGLAGLAGRSRPKATTYTDTTVRPGTTNTTDRR